MNRLRRAGGAARSGDAVGQSFVGVDPADLSAGEGGGCNEVGGCGEVPGVGGTIVSLSGRCVGAKESVQSFYPSGRL